MLKIILLVETESCLGALLCWTEKLGLAGPAGILNLPLTPSLADRERESDRADQKTIGE